MSAMFMQRILPLLLLLLLVSLTWWVQQKVDPGTAQVQNLQRHDPDYIMENFEASSMDQQGKLQYQMSARQMLHYPDDDSSEFEQITGKLYSDDIQTWRVDATRALASSQGKHILLEGAVTAHRLPTAQQLEVTIQTSNVTVTPESNLVETSDPITLTEGRSVINAVGMRMHTKEKRLELLARIRGVYENTP